MIHQPRASVGRLAGLADRAALTVVSAPQSGSAARPAGSYAEAMSGAWSRLVEVPFAGLDFSDVRWALGPPSAEAVQKAGEKFCEDDGALAVLAIFAHYGSAQAKEACTTLARRRYGQPKRVIDLYLRSSPGSPARKALWDYFDGNDSYKPKVAAQGGDGVLTRLSMLALFALGLLGAMLLLGWLAIRLFTQAAVAFVLLLAAPLALFFPLLGDSGRRAFKTWGLTLLGATLAKLIYAAFLSVVLLGIAILGGSAPSPATGFLLSAAFAWAVFLKRAEIVGWLSIGEPDRQAHHGIAPTLAALTIARRLSRTATGSGGGALRAGWRRNAEWRRARRAERGEATRATAGDSLRGRARALADSRHAEARPTVEDFEARYGRPRRSASGAAKEARRGGARRGEPGGAALARRPPSPSGERRRARRRPSGARLRRRPGRASPSAPATSVPASCSIAPSATSAAAARAGASATSGASPPRTPSCCAARAALPTTPTGSGSAAASSRRCPSPSAGGRPSGSSRAQARPAPARSRHRAARQGRRARTARGGGRPPAHRRRRRAPRAPAPPAPRAPRAAPPAAPQPLARGLSGGAPAARPPGALRAGLRAAARGGARLLPPPSERAAAARRARVGRSGAAPARGGAPHRAPRRAPRSGPARRRPPLPRRLSALRGRRERPRRSRGAARRRDPRLRRAPALRSAALALAGRATRRRPASARFRSPSSRRAANGRWSGPAPPATAPPSSSPSSSPAAAGAGWRSGRVNDG